MDPRTAAATKVQAPGPTSREGSYGAAAAARWAAAVAPPWRRRGRPGRHRLPEHLQRGVHGNLGHQVGVLADRDAVAHHQSEAPGSPRPSARRRRPRCASVEPRSVTAATGPSTTSRWSRAGVRRCDSDRTSRPHPRSAPAAGVRDGRDRSGGPAIDAPIGASGRGGGCRPARSGGPGAARAGHGGGPVRAAPHTSHHRSAQTTGSRRRGSPWARRLRPRSSQQRPRSHPVGPVDHVVALPGRRRGPGDVAVGRLQSRPQGAR